MLVTPDVAQIASLLNKTKGAVIACPTETFYGLSARIVDIEAVERIIRIKGRETTKGMIILVPDMMAASLLAEIDDRSINLLNRFWPGSLSVILRAKQHLDSNLTPGGKVAIRVSPNPLAHSLTEQAGPITSTSANISGSPPARTADDITAQNLDIDGILDGGGTPGEKPSTLIDLTAWPPVCVRQGVIPFETILSFL